MKPVFIGGCERSGTTMLGAMLGAHPRYLCPPEMQFKWALLREGRDGRVFDQEQVRSIVGSDIKAELQGWKLSEQNWRFEAAPAASAVEQIVRGYGALAGKPDPDVWIDHTPNNLRWAATLAAEFMNATFIHIVRDGRAVAASLMRLEWGPNTTRSAAHHWLEGLSFGLGAETALASRCVRVRYEDLVRDPESSLRRVCEASGIEFHPAMTKGDGYEVNAYSKGQHALVGRPPVNERVSAWKKELSTREVEIFEAIVGDQLALLGYEARFGLTASPPNLSERWSTGVRDLLKSRVTNRFRKLSRIRAARRAEQ